MTSKKYPEPVYVAAGAGDYAVEQLRKLPAALNELPARLTRLRRRVATTDFDLDRLRHTARRNAAAALGEARTVYAGLVARGERVVDRPSTGLVVRETPRPRAGAPVPADEPVKAAAKPVKAAAKPVKRTRTPAGE